MFTANVRLEGVPAAVRRLANGTNAAHGLVSVEVVPLVCHLLAAQAAPILRPRTVLKQTVVAPRCKIRTDVDTISPRQLRVKDRSHTKRDHKQEAHR
jgi:hypothetical protein